MLLAANPVAAQSRLRDQNSGADHGHQALHTPLENAASTETIAALTAAHPSAVQSQLKHENGADTGKRALHVGLENSASTATIALLLEAHPEASQLELLNRDGSGCGKRALHLALEHGASVEVTARLVDACPGLLSDQKLLLQPGFSPEGLRVVLRAIPTDDLDR